MSDRCEVPLKNATSDQIRDILKSARRIAVVGHSDDPARDSYRIGRYLAGQGYEVFPVNPNVRSTPALKFYPDLASVPGPIDIVDIFRRSSSRDGPLHHGRASGDRRQLTLSRPGGARRVETRPASLPPGHDRIGREAAQDHRAAPKDVLLPAGEHRDDDQDHRRQDHPPDAAPPERDDEAIAPAALGGAGVAD